MMGVDQAIADLPGGNNMYSAYVYVTDHQGNYAAGVDVWLQVITWYGDEIDPELYYSADFATTDSYGFAYLECLVPPQYSDGLWLMTAYMQDPDYTLLSAQNTSTGTWATISPSFEVLYDPNQNGVYENWEMALAQKFCPVLFQPKDDNGSHWNAAGWDDYTLGPVPVEAMDLNGDGVLDRQDVRVLVYNGSGQEVGEFPMSTLWTESGYNYAGYYPAAIERLEQHNGVEVNGITGVYYYKPHYQWASDDDHEGNGSWYSKWNALYYQEAIVENNTWYKDGTIYVFIECSAGQCRILYNMHFPFNAAANRHEGDWQGIALQLDSQNPSGANIVSVEYRFHGEKTVRTIPVPYSQSVAEALYDKTFEDDGNDNPAFANKYFVIAGTHPVTFGGGRTKNLGIEGWGSHAQYPSPGIWERTIVNIKEYVVESGSIYLDSERFDFNNYQNIKIIPPKQYVLTHYQNNPEYSWVVFGGWWGNVFSYPSADQNFWADLVNGLVGVATNAVSFGFWDVTVIPESNIAAKSPYGGYYE